MANLPDLDTSQIGIIAFWNATQHGVSSIDPTECLSDPNIVTYTQYDNGIEGTYHLPVWDGGYIELKFRVKGDGWFITWLPRVTVPETNQQGVDSPWVDNATDPDGYFNLLWDWTKSRNNITPTQSSLERAIYNLATYLSNWSGITYSENDVGYYCYHFPSATGIYQDSEQETSAANAPGYFNGGISYTSGTSLYYARATGVIEILAAEPDIYGNAEFEGTTIVPQIVNEAATRLGSIDISSLMPSSGTVYTNGGEIYQSGWGGNHYGKISHLVIWG